MEVRIGSLRDEGLDARNFFLMLTKLPPFHRNQFGGIRRRSNPERTGRSFSGITREFRQNLSQTLVGRVPSDAARNGILCSGPV